MKRFLALLGALLMVLVAVLIRGVISGDSPGRGGDRNSRGSVRWLLLCDNELRDVCKPLKEEGLDVIYADPGATVDKIVKGDVPDFDLWLTVGPWDKVLQSNLEFGSPPSTSELQGLPLLATPSDILGRSPAVLVALGGNAAQVAMDACPKTVEIQCVTAGSNLSIGMTTPSRGDGLVALGQAVVSLVGSSDFGSNDPGFADAASWVAGRARDSRSSKMGKQMALGFALTQRGHFQAATALEVDVIEFQEAHRSMKAFYPSSLATADVRLFPRSGRQLDDMVTKETLDRIKDLLAQEGWRVGGAPPSNAPADAPKTLPEGNGLPDPGVLQVLRDTWGPGG